MADDKRTQRPGRGQAPVEEKQFDERVVHIDRVARVVKGGRRFRFRALVVVGDRKGRVGIGIAKGADVTAAVAKAVDVAKKNFHSLKLYKGTFPHESQAKVGGSNILLKPASPGTGLIAGGVVRTVLEVSGVSNALSKSIGSSNKINTAYATLEALKKMESAKNWVTRSNKATSAEGNKKKVPSDSKFEVEPNVEKKTEVAKKTPVKKDTTKTSVKKPATKAPSKGGK
jgi:small subunit ribosomal protein S5